MSLRIGRRTEHHEAVHHFVVEEIADGKMSAEHVLPEQPAVSLETHALRIQHQLGATAEVPHDVASRRLDLLEEETLVHIGSHHNGEILDRFTDGPLVDDCADHPQRL